MSSLDGRIAVVAGATRGAGRGIAVALGEAGATVYCTGRSSRTVPRPPREPGSFSLAGRPETIEETAELVTAAGGRGIAVRCDHSDPAQVEALFARIDAEHGGLDVLVNDVWGGEDLVEGKPFWEADVDKALAMLDRAVKTHIVTSRYGVPLLLKRGKGLVVEITDGDTLAWRMNFAYDVVKTTVIRLAFAMAEELRPHGIASVALTPGFLRSEAMLEHFGVTEANWRDGAEKDPHFAASETPLYVGRAVAALAGDDDVMTKTGRAWSSWRLAREYGFTDADGSRPDWGRHAAESTEPVFAQQVRSHLRFVEGFADALEGTWDTEGTG